MASFTIFLTPYIRKQRILTSPWKMSPRKAHNGCWKRSPNLSLETVAMSVYLHFIWWPFLLAEDNEERTSILHWRKGLLTYKHIDFACCSYINRQVLRRNLQCMRVPCEGDEESWENTSITSRKRIRLCLVLRSYHPQFDVSRVCKDAKILIERKTTNARR